MPVYSDPVVPGSSSPAIGTLEYFITRRAAVYTQLEELEASVVEEYQTDNAGQRMGVKYIDPEKLQRLIAFYDRKIAHIKSKGGRALAVFRRGA